MVHEARQAQRDVADLRQQNQQLLMSMVSGQQQQLRQAQPQAPAVEIDPERRKEVEALLAPILLQQQQQYAQLAMQTGQVQLAAAVQGQHPEVAKRTQAIWSDAVMKGAHLNGFTPAQALTWAKGELVDMLVASAAQSRQVQQGQAFNGQSQVLPTQSAVAPPQQNQQLPEPDMDEEPEKASAYYAQRLGTKGF